MYVKNLSEYENQFEEVYLSHFSRMKRFAQQYVIQEEDAENIVQDIFFDIWENRLDFSSFTNLNGYLLSVLRNRCIDFLRKRTVEQKVINNIHEEQNRELKLKLESLIALDNNILSENEITDIVQNAIEQLPERCRQILVLNKFEGKKQRTIANELNISIHTVESQMAIAYKKLNEILKDHLFIFVFIFI
jgi:RNA polymerase sigma-70 factor (family 1)